MSGHSKWATIKRKKAKLDAAKGKVFTRITKEITVAAREGGGDPDGNARLRLLMANAKEANMPQDNIIRAIKKGTGELTGAIYEAITYEGYGPEGIAVIVEALTDNKRRTVADVRHVFAKLGGKMAEHGAVGWMFAHKGVVVLKADDHTEDEILEKLLEYNIEDVIPGEGEFSVQCAIADIESVKKGAQQAGFTVVSAEIEWVPKDTTSLEDGAHETRAYKFLEALEDLEDVQSVYTNLK